MFYHVLIIYLQFWTAKTYPLTWYVMDISQIQMSLIILPILFSPISLRNIYVGVAFLQQRYFIPL